MTTFDLTLLFADICNSTQLYEKLGDQPAKELILDRLQSVESIAKKHNGVVVKTIGDELLIRFDCVQSAVEAACEMQHTSRKQFLQQTDLEKRLEIRIALHCGPTIMENNDVFGDSVNVASRISMLTKAGQILTSKETVKSLPALLQERSRHIDRINIKGKSEDIDIYEIFDIEDDVTQMTVGISRKAEQLASLHIQYQDQKHILHCLQAPFTVGRNEFCDLVIEDDLVSRQHLTFESRRGKFFIVDLSTNGTWLKNERGREMFLRREEISLPVSGDISFGKSFRECPKHVLNFKITQE